MNVEEQGAIQDNTEFRNLHSTKRYPRSCEDLCRRVKRIDKRKKEKEKESYNKWQSYPCRSPHFRRRQFHASDQKLNSCSLMFDTFATILAT